MHYRLREAPPTITPRKLALRYLTRAIALLFTASLSVNALHMMIRTLEARTGYPGGELFIPILLVLLPVMGWKCKGWFSSLL